MRTIRAAATWVLILVAVSSSSALGSGDDALITYTAARLDALTISIYGSADELRAAERVNYHRVEDGTAVCMRAAGRAYRPVPFEQFPGVVAKPRHRGAVAVEDGGLAEQPDPHRLPAGAAWPAWCDVGRRVLGGSDRVRLLGGSAAVVAAGARGLGVGRVAGCRGWRRCPALGRAR
jgi:hypothetical protein